jgi:hypothetical protein
MERRARDTVAVFGALETSPAGERKKGVLVT